MRFVVLGAGLQGSACAFDLMRSEGVDEVVLADLNVSKLPRFLEGYREDDRLRTVALDANDEDAVRRVAATLRGVRPPAGSRCRSRRAASRRRTARYRPPPHLTAHK